jgi:ribosomal protein S18 acetylase RimI-like enzyme
MTAIMPPAWRPMRAADLAAVAALEPLCHAPLPPEGEALFAERLALFPAGCLAAEDAAGLAAYLVSHPWGRAAPPALGVRLGALPAGADALHLHDIAIAPRARGMGLVGAALSVLVKAARAAGLPAITLVAVHGTAPLWARHGFVRTGAAPASYGAGETMLRSL